MDSPKQLDLDVKLWIRCSLENKKTLAYLMYSFNSNEHVLSKFFDSFASVILNYLHLSKCII